MDEDISIINSNTRKEKIKSFFVNNKKKLLGFLIIIILLIISFFGYGEFRDYQREKVSNLFYSTVIDLWGCVVNKFTDMNLFLLGFQCSLIFHLYQENF